MGARLAYELTSGLASQGHKVTVVCEDLFDCGSEYEVIKGVTILRYKLPYSLKLNFRRYEEHIQGAKQLLIKYLPDPPRILSMGITSFNI
jgi:hypothetical protein